MGMCSKVRAARTSCVVGLLAVALGTVVPAQEPDLFAGRTLHWGDGSAVFGDVDGDGHIDAVARYLQQIRVSSGDGFGGFLSPVAYGSPAIGHTLWGHVLGDFNGDGALDVAATKFPLDIVEVRLNDGTGVFGEAVAVPMEHLPEHMATADFDGDGHLDLAINASYPHVMCVLLGDGAGGFSAPNVYEGMKNTKPFIVHDLDADGAPDIILAGAPPWGLAVMFGDGLGGLETPTVLEEADYFRGPRVADIDGDQHLDIVAISHPLDVEGELLSVFLGDGLGAFPTRVDSPLPKESGSLALGDLDHDGELDAVLTGSFALTHDRRSFSMLGDGSGAFTLASEFHGGTAFHVEIVDHDQDGDADALITNEGGLAVIHGDGQGGFDTAPTYPTSFLAGALTPADFDLDGELDLILSSAGVLEIRFGNADGEFSAPQVVPWTEGVASDIAVGDLNGDTWPDLALLRPDTFEPSMIHVLLSDGQGGFDPVLPPARVGRATRDIELVDVDGDGALDLLAANAKDDDISWVRGDGAGGFSDRQDFPVGDFPISVRAADLNEDGRVDLVALNDVAGLVGSLTVYLSAGPGDAFELPFEIGTPVDSGGSVLIADLNDDGHLDLTSGADQVLIHLGDGAGGFHTVSSGLTLGGGSADLAAADIDGDLHTDLVIVDYFRDLFTVLHGDSSGQFAAVSHYVAGGAPTEMVLADFDGDLRPDVAVGNSESGEVTVHLNRAPWTNLGEGLGGVAGIPALGGDGLLVAGSPGSIALRKAAPSSPALLFGSLDSTPTPFKGGTLVAFPFVLARAWTTDALGDAALNWPALPSGIPAGLTLYFQAAIADANAPVGVALSNALRAGIP